MYRWGYGDPTGTPSKKGTFSYMLSKFVFLVSILTLTLVICFDFGLIDETASDILTVWVTFQNKIGLFSVSESWGKLK